MPRKYTAKPVKPSGTPEQWAALNAQLSRLKRWEDESNSDPPAKTYREMLAQAEAAHRAGQS